ncbi:MAG: SBBP repeat-containing protein [Acidobacteria bacterium]|nr:SBBP repeat-containing protein [Acidobacteriota bacterium]
MKAPTTVARYLPSLLLGLIGWQVLRIPPPSLAPSPARFDPGSQSRVISPFWNSPLSFEPNQGQTHSQVRFLARGRSHTLFLTAADAVLTLHGPAEPKTSAPSATVVRISLVGANPAPRIEAADPLPGISNYYIGNDPQKWRTHIPHYARVAYRDVYPGVSLVYYGNQGRLEYDFSIAPGVDPDAIRLVFQGAEQMRIDSQGDLVLETAAGEIRQHKPAIYQEVAGARRQIAGGYALKGSHAVGFRLASYDRNLPLIIDPVLSYSTYLGGTEGTDDFAGGIAVDSSGNAYVTGFTDSPDFPTANAAQSSEGGIYDVFVTKLNPAGNTLLYSTYIGGSSTERGFGIAVDASGNAYVTGSTGSDDFPTVTPLQGKAPFGDAFVLKLGPTGSLLFSTFLGGDGPDQGYGIAVDRSGGVYVTGSTASSNFPIKNAVQSSLKAVGNCLIIIQVGSIVITGRAPCKNAFVAKLNPAGPSLEYSTYLGGTNLNSSLSEGDIGRSIAVDAAGNAYVGGETNSSDFPTTAGAFQGAYGGRRDAFVAKLNPTGDSLLYSTYLGGNDEDIGSAIALDASGDAYLTGLTKSANFPTAAPFQATYGGGLSDGFVTKLNAAGSALVYSTFLGGSKDDGGFGIALDSSGNAYVTGETSSTDFPLASPTQPSSGGKADAFVTKLNAGGSALVYSTFLGGSSSDGGSGIAVDLSGNAYAAGYTLAANFPTTQGAFQTVLHGDRDAFVARIADAVSPTVTSVSAASFLGPALAAESIASAFGEGLATETRLADKLPLPTTLAGTTVKITDSAGKERLAPLFYASPGQINFLIPAGTASGTARVIVTSGTGATVNGTVQIEPVAPGLFAANASGQGVAAAAAARVSATGAQSPVTVVRYDASLGKNVAVPIDLGPATDQVILILYGTGIRFRIALSAVSARIGGDASDVLFAGPQGAFVGLDQVNVHLPRTLIGRGDVDVALVVDGKQANTVTINIR